MKRNITVLLILLIAHTANGLWEEDKTGTWPQSWPKEMELLRAHARSIGVANGTQESIYEIHFSDRDEFEKAWPIILSLKTYGAPVRLYRVGSEHAQGLHQLESNALPTVRMYAPPRVTRLLPDGKQELIGSPWPKEIVGPHGEMPEYVRENSRSDPTLVPSDLDRRKWREFNYRARIDIDLVLDGTVLDLNRVQLPTDTPIVDHRFDKP